MEFISAGKRAEAVEEVRSGMHPRKRRVSFELINLLSENRERKPSPPTVPNGDWTLLNFTHTPKNYPIYSKASKLPVSPWLYSIGSL